MPMKKRAKKSTDEQEERLSLLYQYESLHQAWGHELQNDSTDWVRLFRLYYTLAEMEKRSPWLKKESLS